MILKIKLFIQRLLYLAAKLYWYIFKPVTSGAKAVLTFEDEVLLVRHNLGSYWTFPGGGIEKGEVPEAAVKRELWEELKIKLDSVHYTGQFFNTANHKRDTVYCFWTEVKDKNFTIDPVEIAEAKWVHKSQLPNLGPNAKKMYDCYLKYAGN